MGDESADISKDDKIDAVERIVANRRPKGKRNMIQAEREKVIMSLLEKNDIVTVEDLVSRLQLSPVTIRRYIQRMEERGQLLRTRGGATLRTALRSEFPSYETREIRNVREKAAIARKAASFIENGDSLIVSAGTSTHALGIELSQFQNLTIFTNGLTIATELTNAKNAEVFVPGGAVDFKNFGTTGPNVEHELNGVLVPKAFLAATGVSAEHGVSMHSQTAAKTLSDLIKAAEDVTLLVDSTKFEAPRLFIACPATDLNRIITDQGIDPEVRSNFESHGVEIIVVDVD